MKTLYPGSRGPDVKRWQIFLRGLSPSSCVVINSTFDECTVSETKKFQDAHGLTPDAVIGPQTMSAALKLGYSIMSDNTAEESGPNWPPRPIDPPLSLPDRIKLFGRIPFTPNPTPQNPEGISIPSLWVSENIATISVPQLSGVLGAPKDCAIQVNKRVSEQFLRLFECWQSSGLWGNILTWGGAWAPRFVRGSRTHLSNHAWGTAFDVNVQWNGLGVTPALKGEKGSVRELVETAYENGFYWGGWFKGRPDGMHFEVCRLT